MEIWLSNGNYDKVLIPVNPEEMGSSDNRNFEDMVLANGDEKTVISGRNLREYSISSFFPVHAPFAIKGTLHTPHWYVRKLESWMDARKVLLLQVTGTNINRQVTIRSFEWKEVGGAVGDVDYTLSLKEYRPISFTKIAPTKPTSNSSKGKNNNTRPSTNKPKPKTYIVKKNDSLSKIAKMIYKDANQWRKIYNANKKLIGPNEHLIYPGQKLVIP